MKTQKHRRQKRKTDYLKRLKLLKSRRPRMVFRRTDRYLIAQYIISKEAQDRIVMGADSRILLKYGWPKNFPGSLKSIPASYLFGYLIGKQIKKKKLENPIVDSGMLRTGHKTRIYSFLKGLIDSGIEISCPEDAFPDEERIKGGSLKNKIPFGEIKSKIEKEK